MNLEIFKKLKKRNITYSVISSVIKFKIPGYSNNEWFIAVALKDISKVRDLHFR